MASDKNRTPTSSELFSSAKLVAEAAQSTFSNQGDKVDKGRVAGAGADLLGAAQDYGKLEQDKGIGQYVEKAENYLHQYKSSQSGPTATATPPAKAEGEPESHPSGDHGKDSGSGGGGGGGGVGDYMKMAQGFLK